MGVWNQLFHYQLYPGQKQTPYSGRRKIQNTEKTKIGVNVKHGPNNKHFNTARLQNNNSVRLNCLFPSIMSSVHFQQIQV